MYTYRGTCRFDRILLSTNLERVLTSRVYSIILNGRLVLHFTLLSKWHNLLQFIGMVNIFRRINLTLQSAAMLNIIKR